MTCTAPEGTCSNKTSCSQMKALIDHARSCPVKAAGKQCKQCTKFPTFVDMHAKTCTARESECKVPFCFERREKYRRLQMQQTRMDDRRRQAQNELYTGGK